MEALQGENGKVAVELTLGRAYVFRVKEFECARSLGLANSGGTTVFFPSRFFGTDFLFGENI